MITTLKVALHPSVQASAPEAKYALRVLLRMAGYAHEFVWSTGLADADIYYGPPEWNGKASCSVLFSGKSFVEAHALEPRGLHQQEGLDFLDFGEAQPGLHRTPQGGVCFTSDIVLAAFWLLSGARERHYPRDNRDNFHIADSFLVKSGLLERPAVSLYASFLRRHFAALGKPPAALPWASGAGRAAFVFTHDVDYPEISRSIEALRVLAGRTHAPRRVIPSVLSGANHFWKFAEWVSMEARYGARPAFYFSARKGSLAQYALGTPDCFYDVHSPRFRDLFRSLREQGCEIGLHASYNAFHSEAQLRHEKESLEQASGGAVEGTRHHYWRVNPDAPHETLARHQRIGLRYDCSLGYEFFPGFRRGVCHPFRPFHPEERRELEIVELPTAWMDDHFDRRLTMNGIADPIAPEPEVRERTSAFARRLLDMARVTGGVAVVDYHVRGMNADFYPRYGPWLAQFTEKHFDSSVHLAAPKDLARQFCTLQQQLDGVSRDCTQEQAALAIAQDAHPRAGRAFAAEECTVGLLTAEEESAWESFVEWHPEATVYHSLAWKRVTEEGLGHRAYYLRALNAQGKLGGVLPLFLVTGLFGRRLVSMPMRDRGGVVADCTAASAALLRGATELTRSLNCKYLEIRSLSGLPAEAADSLRFQRSSDWITTRIDLQPGRDALWKALDRDAIRWAIGKADRQGLRFVTDNSEMALHLFYSLFARTRKAMGIPVFPRSFFASMWRHVIRAGRGQLFIVYQNDEPIHAMICFASKDTFIPAYAAPQNRWRKQYPNEFMFWNSIVWAMERGFRFYDFGADSFRQEGLLFFKRKWGGEQRRMAYDFYLHRAQALPVFDSSSPSYQTVRRLWSVLPEAVATPLGGWVTRQLS